ncbi:MAG: hypothetical protein AABX83_00645 [Nanoarchaeota archaeon]
MVELKTKVNEKIREDVKFTMSKEKYFEEGRADELDYAHLDHLKQIIHCGTETSNKFINLL